MGQIMRDLVQVYCIYDIYSIRTVTRDSSRSLIHPFKVSSAILDVTDDFVSFAESDVNIERDGTSGTMTSIAYELKFAKTKNTLFLKAAYEAFISKDASFKTYDDIISSDEDKYSEKNIDANTLSGLFKSLRVNSDDYTIPTDSVRLFVCFAKDNSVNKPKFTSKEDLLAYSGFQRVIDTKLNYETYSEDFNYISLEATTLDLQRYLNSKGDFDYDVPVNDLGANLKDILFQHKLDIPLYTEHTTPSFNANTNVGVKQRILSTENYSPSDNWVYYLPSVSWDRELIGFPKDFRGKITFGSQRGENVYKYLEQRDADEYLMRNTTKNKVKVNFKTSFNFNSVTRTDVYSLSNDINLDKFHAVSIQLLKVKETEIKDLDLLQKGNGIYAIDSGKRLTEYKVVKQSLYDCWFKHSNFQPFNRNGYWYLGDTNKVDQLRNFSFNDDIELDGEGGYNTLVLALKTVYPDMNKGESYGSAFYFDDNYKLTTALGSAQADEDKEDNQINGLPLVKGVQPNYLLEYILKNKWNENFKVQFLDNGYKDSTNFEFSAILPELGDLPYPKTLFIASESLSYKENAQFHVNVVEVLKWYKVRGFEYSVINNTTLLIAPRQYFYDNRIQLFGEKDIFANTISFNSGVDVFERGSLELTTNQEMCYTEVLYGCDKGDYDIIAGAYDPCAVFKYETGYVADENKSFELTTDIRMDFYGMYYLLYRWYGEDTDKTNDNIFAIDCKIQDYTIGEGLRQFTYYNQYMIWDYLKSIVDVKKNGINTTITYYNALSIPPIATWLFNLRLFRIFATELGYVQSDDFTAESGKIVFDMAMISKDRYSFAGNPLFSRELKGDIDLTIPKFNGAEIYKPHFMLGLANIEIGSLRKIWSLNGVDEPNRIVRFIDNDGIVRYGFIKDYGYNIWDSNPSQMKLLLAKPQIVEI